MRSALKSILIPVIALIIFISSYFSWIAEKVLHISYSASAILGLAIIIAGIIAMYYGEGKLKIPGL
ncbi:MAG: hypothetical protein DRJ26_02945 [Candidatus Methanomethylicota archaeon]|uniref:Uncharacterized protein n=1 Tax=Thermoproteota archaeon TaxID=2056631 RepID=A0A497F2Z7_9CREN|nr:MAG: hypothetical protein DRJ26_02945 [Candidatus Verstraetearchaeota archaeon]